MRIRIFRFGFTLLFTVLSFGSFAQQENDTLSQAVELHKASKYKQEYALLAQYRQTHKSDVNVEWLFGQASFYLGKTREVMRVYEANIKANNENYYLKLDYAFKLVEVGHLEKAKQLLTTYLPYDTTNAQIHASLAKIYFWQSNYNEASTHILAALRLAPDNPTYKAQHEDIARALSPWIALGAELNKDNQPLRTITPTIEGGMYVNTLLNADASFQPILFDTNGTTFNAFWLRVGNRSVFAPQAITLRLNAGLISYPNVSTKPTWSVGLDKTFFNSLTLTAQAERKPYLSMLSSLDTSIATTDLTASAKWERPRSFMAQVAYSVSRFDDKNTVSTRSAWVVSPQLKVWRFGFRAGYGYSFTTSKHDSYVATPSTTQLFHDIYFNPNVPGHFKSYLTPEDQEVNSVIGVVNFDPCAFAKFTISGSYGFKASIKTPYLYGYYDAQGNVVVAKDFYTEKYTTLDLNVRADFRLTRHVSAKLEYHRSNPNYYYENHLVAVGLKIILCDGK